MIKRELTQQIAKQTGHKADHVQEILESAMEIIKQTVANDQKVSLVGFGTFQKKQRAKKLGTNPSTGERMVIQPKTIPFFKPGKSFKDLVK